MSIGDGYGHGKTASFFAVEVVPTEDQICWYSDPVG